MQRNCYTHSAQMRTLLFTRKEKKLVNLLYRCSELFLHGRLHHVNDPRCT